MCLASLYLRSAVSRFMCTAELTVGSILSFRLINELFFATASMPGYSVSGFSELIVEGLC
jgi:hypothetical protein